MKTHNRTSIYAGTNTSNINTHMQVIKIYLYNIYIWMVAFAASDIDALFTKAIIHLKTSLWNNSMLCMWLTMMLINSHSLSSFLIWFHCNVHVMNVLSSAFCYFCPVSVDAFILGKMQDGNMENNQTKGNLLSLYRWFERSPWFYSSVPFEAVQMSARLFVPLLMCASGSLDNLTLPVLVEFLNHFNDELYISLSF